LLEFAQLTVSIPEDPRITLSTESNSLNQQSSYGIAKFQSVVPKCLMTWKIRNNVLENPSLLTLELDSKTCPRKP
jgi:hypothetical protein